MSKPEEYACLLRSWDDRDPDDAECDQAEVLWRLMTWKERDEARRLLRAK